MTTIVSNVFSINGVIDTNKSVMENLQIIGNACCSWVTFDNVTGRWSVVVNTDDTAVATITDANIVGAVTISGNGLREFYNKVQFDFPHKDLLDQKDTATLSIPLANRYPNEFENVLNFSTEVINDPVQAAYLAGLELKQTRIDKVIQFSTDFSMWGIKAGDLINITSEVYGYTNKKFRILTVEEEDGDDNILRLSFTAYEHDTTIYDTADLVREDRSAVNNVLSECNNTATQASNGEATGNSLLAGLAGPAGALLLTQLLNSLLGSPTLKGALAAAGAGSLATKYTNFDALTVDVNGTAPGIRGTANQFDEFNFVCPATGYYTFQTVVEFGEDPATNASTQSNKALFIGIFTDGFYTGTTGGASTYLSDTFDVIGSDPTLVNGSFSFDYTGDQYGSLQNILVTELQEGVEYFVSTFVAAESPIVISTYKFIDVRATTPATITA